ncbi:MAG TPA: branched-chain amino acid ABC transporter permease [Candidatus Eremiobacteraceae bacterium]|nr:branched-chain amino acid ABC transporter permease [Candidatus Eremiobacteraceae bacterium]
MPPQLLEVQGLNSLAFAMLLFLLAAGFSLIYGVGRIANLAHGTFYMVGAYMGYTVATKTGNFWAALAIAALLGGVLGWLVERLLLRRLRGRELDQVLLTVGLAFILADVIRAIWGADIRSSSPPAVLSGLVPVFGVQYPAYQLFVIVVGVVAFAALQLLLRSPLGARVRAVTADPQIADSLGVPAQAVASGTFTAAVALAAFGGAVGGPIIALAPGLDLQMMLLALVVVVVGGLGSVAGAFVGAIIVAAVNGFGSLFYPEFAPFLIFALMVVVLGFRPQGLLGRRG